MPASGKKFKVRTGCITCKIRKIKCDENKPACTRCTSTGRKCDGYIRPDTEEPEKRQTTVVLRQSNQILYNRNKTLRADISALPGITSAHEHQWLEYFSQHAGPALAGLADKSFWTHELPQLSVSEPAIRHALLAVGSSYAQFGTTSKPSGAISVIDHDHGVKHYNLAITKLRQSLLRTPGDATVPLICCLLFICLECLYGNQPLMLEHLNNGLRILSSTPAHGTDSIVVRSIRQKLGQIFRRLDALATLYGKPMLTPLGDPNLAFDLEIPSTFDDIFEAKMYLDTVSSMSLGFIRRAIDGSLFERYQDYSAIILQRRIQEQLVAWRNALDSFEHTSSTKDIGYHKDTLTRLRIEHHASFIYLSNCLDSEETSYDAYNAQFALIVSLARSILVKPPEETSTAPGLSSSIATLPTDTNQPYYSSSFSFEPSLLPSLYLTAIKCRDPIIRREALSLMNRHNGNEGLWSARLSGRMARRIVEIEERSMLMSPAGGGAAEAFMEESPSMRMWTSNGAVLTGFPSKEFRVTSADINRTFDEGPKSPVQITLYTRPDGILGQEHSWIEELWF